MKTFFAAIASLVIGFGAGYAVINQTTVKEQAETIVTLTQEVDSLNNLVALRESELKELSADNKRLFEDRNAGVLFGMQLCKQMKDSRSCLMELGLKTRSTVDFK
ncbi:hypothetical protein LQI10_000089 [Salmonella enterica]|nr:hypothetical protein [Salmonella enterica]ECU8400727.1 hypothetical protein [Salmonella enterica subsp. enterica serovar Bareilly]EDC7360779.1 hypothetical protein [Salmonella enterica subsp. enterica serovar Enteritidis]EDE4835539.1 hypothetical protein [Salmonella enterica subsp. enterica serovar Newport]EDV0911058.1 hypothetical protein [Salmonella enterica subsp. enterica serovar Java]